MHASSRICEDVVRIHGHGIRRSRMKYFLTQLVEPTVSSLTPSGSCISLGGESGSRMTFNYISMSNLVETVYGHGEYVTMETPSQA